jgi:hypothetical protein
MLWMREYGLFLLLACVSQGARISYDGSFRTNVIALEVFILMQ